MWLSHLAWLIDKQGVKARNSAPTIKTSVGIFVSSLENEGRIKCCANMATDIEEVLYFFGDFNIFIRFISGLSNLLP